jgi:hypothetical protein
MRRRWFALSLAIVTWMGDPHVARAGMPAIALSDIARMRVQTISFFLAVFLASAGLVQAIWNVVGRDFPRWPRLGYGKAVGLVSLWGLLFLLVLTMISGARELMTPGAWRKEGLTYILRDDRPGPAVASVESGDDAERRRRLDQLRILLWNYARHHDGSFPGQTDVPEIPAELWTLPDPSGIRYLYNGGQEADKGDSPLVYEPGIYGRQRLVLLTSGAIRGMTSAEIRRSFPPAGP